MKTIIVINNNRTPVEIGTGLNAIPLAGRQKTTITIPEDTVLPAGVKVIEDNTNKNDEEEGS